MNYQSSYLSIDLQEYSHLFAMDWSLESDSEISYKRRGNSKIHQSRISSDVKSLKEYFKQFKGKKVLVFEETTGAHWLYVNLQEVIDRVIICDPYRNSLLKEGPKTDKIDSFKLMHLLLNRSLKEVYHSSSSIYVLRRFMSGYEDLVEEMVRLKNQIAAFKRSSGFSKRAKDYQAGDRLEKYIYDQQQELLDIYESKKEAYEKEMRRIVRSDEILKHLTEISGIGLVIAIMIYSRVVDGYRFANKYKYYGYCGLALYTRESGKSIKGKKRGRYNPRMKWAYKTAAKSAIYGKNDIHDYYMYLLGKGLEETAARNEVARYIARVSLAMIKNGTPYKPYSWRKH